MKNLLASIVFIIGLFLVSSCSSETCQTCTITQIITVDGVETGRQTLSSDVEYCGDALDQIKSQTSEATQMLGTTTQTITQTVECQ